MFSHLLISIILTLGVVIIGYRYLITNYLKQHPTVDAGSAKASLKLPVVQFGVWALAFIPFWAFLPTHPQKDGGEAFLSSDLANWEIFREIANIGDVLYLLQTLLGIGFILFGGIAISVIYSLIKQKIYSDPTIKTLSTIYTIFTTLVVWNILVIIVGGFVTLLFSDFAPAIFITLFILVNIVLAWWIIRKAIRMQKSFRASFPTLTQDLSNDPSSIKSGETKKCPYCGETILSVAKKCKHCGEWIKEGDVVVDVNETPISVPRNAFREKVMAERKITSNNEGGQSKSWLWWLIGIAVIAIACIIIFSNKSDNDDEPFDPAWYQEPQEPEPSESDFIIN